VEVWKANGELVLAGVLRRMRSASMVPTDALSTAVTLPRFHVQQVMRLSVLSQTRLVTGS